MRHRIAVPLSCALLMALSACQEPEEENVQLRAENASRALEERYREIEAEAENRTNAAIEPLNNEAEALLQQVANEANVAVNAQ